MIRDSLIHAPIYGGPLGYNNFLPNSANFPPVGVNYTDQVHSTIVKRLTDEVGMEVNNDIYSWNGAFNSDGSLFWHHGPNGNVLIRTSDGRVMAENVPGNMARYGVSFSPILKNTLYWFEGKILYAYDTLSKNSTVVRSFDKELGWLGGSLDWIDRKGRYMVLNIGGAIQLYDNINDIIYEGKITGKIGKGYATITPSGKHIIVTSGGLKSYAIDHDAKRISIVGTLFWTLCGDHGDFVSISDKDYFITNDCYDEPGLWRVDITKTQTAANRTKQHSDNMKLLAKDWPDNDGHISCAGDWAFISTEATDDAAGQVSPWRVFKQAIIGINVITGEVMQLVHHRSRGNLEENYRAQPRVCTSWDGSKIAFASNQGLDTLGYSDIYLIELNVVAPEPVPVPVPTTKIAIKMAFGTLAGTVTVEGTIDREELRKILWGS